MCNEEHEYVHKTINKRLDSASAIKLLLEFNPEIMNFTKTLKKPRSGQIIYFYSEDPLYRGT